LLTCGGGATLLLRRQVPPASADPARRATTRSWQRRPSQRSPHDGRDSPLPAGNGLPELLHGPRCASRRPKRSVDRNRRSADILPSQIQDQAFRAAVSRISCHDGQSSRSSPSELSGRWFSGRSSIDCKTTGAAPERKRMPSDVGQARSPLSSRSAAISLIHSSPGLRVVMQDNKKQNCVASLFG